MNLAPLRAFLLVFFFCIFAGCANIVPPTGGTKDTTPPKLLAVSPKDSLLNVRTSRIELRFDEYIGVSDVANEVQIAPLLTVPLSVEAYSKRVIVKIPDSLLLDNTTYRISFGKAIRDIHEDNVFTGYSYMFSTGGYFDSLSLNGVVYNAFTGVRDTGAKVLLYPASKSDSVVVRERPMYVAQTDGSGNFSFKGLPDKVFRIYALKDGNGNLIYDGSGEMIAFLDRTVRPGDSAMPPIRLNLFEEIDTSGKIVVKGKTRNNTPKQGLVPEAEDEAEPGAGETGEPAGLSYSVSVDTTDTRKRNLDVTKPLDIVFSKKITVVNPGRIHLSYDSLGVSVEEAFDPAIDTAEPGLLHISAGWKQNTVYTLRLLKGFVQDSLKSDAMPSRYTFRSKRDEDYAKLHIHLPSKYYGRGFVLVVTRDKDTIWNNPVKDTMVHLTRLAPGAYGFKVVVDRNQNGKWDPGDLFAKVQPEEVVPYSTVINLKAGWENMIDFEEIRKERNRGGTSPGQRDKTRKE